MVRQLLLVLLVLAGPLASAKKNVGWENRFDVPSGYRAYIPKQKADDFSAVAGFDGFLDEGIEADVRTPATHSEPTHHHNHHHSVASHEHGHHDLEQHSDHASSSHHSHGTQHHADHHGSHHTHETSHHSSHHSHGQSFLELSSTITREDEDAALVEAEKNAARVQGNSAALPQLSPSQALAALQKLKPMMSAETRSRSSSSGDLSKEDRPFDSSLHDLPTTMPSPQSPPGDGIGGSDQRNSEPLEALKDADVESLLHEGEVVEINSMDDFRKRINQLEGIIMQRKPGEQSVTQVIGDAAKSGAIMEMLPRVSIRNGLQPGVLPGLVDTASSTAAMLPELIGASPADNVRAIAQLQADPAQTQQLQQMLPQALPDLPQLHPLSPGRKLAAGSEPQGVPSWDAAASEASKASTMNSLLEVAEGAESVPSLRGDQAEDLQYLRGVGQGLETLASMFGGKDAKLQTDAFEMASILSHIGDGSSRATSQLQAVDATREHRLRGDRHHHTERPHGAAPLPPGIGQPFEQPPQFPSQQHMLPTSGFLDRFQDPQRLDEPLKPSTYAAGPSSPQYPAVASSPDSDLSWMLESGVSKGYGGPLHPMSETKVGLDRTFKTLKGFLKKGAKMMEALEPRKQPDTKELPTDGFGGWPQPFWWTRPPAWLDEVPGWMQRLQMKRAGSIHRASAFG